MNFKHFLNEKLNVLNESTDYDFDEISKDKQQFITKNNLMKRLDTSYSTGGYSAGGVHKLLLKDKDNLGYFDKKDAQKLINDKLVKGVYISTIMFNK